MYENSNRGRCIEVTNTPCIRYALWKSKSFLRVIVLVIYSLCRGGYRFLDALWYILRLSEAGNRLFPAET